MVGSKFHIRIYGIQMLLCPYLCNVFLQYLDEAEYWSQSSWEVTLSSKFVLMRPRDFGATDMLCELHWLPVRKQVYYKLLLLTYKTLNRSAPVYLVNQLQDYCPTRALESGDQNLLSVKKTCIMIGDSSFAVAASVLWNALPLPCQIKKNITVDCFKSIVKIGYFFNIIILI